MTFSIMGSLVKEDLETRAKNLLKSKIANKEFFLQPLDNQENQEPIYEEIGFLFKNEYIAPRAGPPFLEYEITPKGKEYAGDK